MAYVFYVETSRIPGALFNIVREISRRGLCVWAARDFFAAPCLGGNTPDQSTNGSKCLYDINRYLYGNVIAYLRYWNVYGASHVPCQSHFRTFKTLTRVKIL